MRQSWMSVCKASHINQYSSINNMVVELQGLRTTALEINMQECHQTMETAYSECSLAPPRSSGETSSPVAAFTKGGPPKNIVPILWTITASSDIVGT